MPLGEPHSAGELPYSEFSATSVISLSQNTNVLGEAHSCKSQEASSGSPLRASFWAGISQKSEEGEWIIALVRQNFIKINAPFCVRSEGALRTRVKTLQWRLGLLLLLLNCGFCSCKQNSRNTPAVPELHIPHQADLAQRIWDFCCRRARELQCTRKKAQAHTEWKQTMSSEASTPPEPSIAKCYKKITSCGAQRMAAEESQTSHTGHSHSEL